MNRFWAYQLLLDYWDDKITWGEFDKLTNGESLWTANRQENLLFN